MVNRFATQTASPSFLQRLWQRRWVKWVLGLAGSGIVLSGILLLLLAAWVSKDLPDPNSLYDRQVAQSTKIYDRTGTVLLYEIHGDEKRTLIPIDRSLKSYDKQPYLLKIENSTNIMAWIG
jgi:membrane peptidoglycan carboxypeptidase